MDWCWTLLYILPLLVSWSLWKVRNNTIFFGFRSVVQSVVANIMGLLKDYLEVPRVSRSRRIEAGLVIRAQPLVSLMGLLREVWGCWGCDLYQSDSFLSQQV